ncbi:MAG: LysM peptidoglycan-binding domain-containing protein [Acidobacteria bacterium]|nr:LysM peptidoglycan-binding domain-containing protein [Acidobacteriota bacterium]
MLLPMTAAALVLTGCPSQTATTPPPQATAPPIAPRTAAAPQEQAKNRAQAQKEQQLIAQVEKVYQSGVDNYRANRLDAARHDFDYAVDMMLTSGLDLKSEGPMADEFNRITAAVSSLEMDALKQGTGFWPKVEQSPVEAAGELTFPSNPELNAKINSELQTTRSDFPLVVNDYVAGYINYFTNNPAGHAHLARSIERAGKYKDMIQRIFREEGVPEDLIYQAVAESGFQPQALNARSGAAGMWQFMPFKGAYGLERNGWFDERFDPEKSTRAYARYMKTLYNQLGDWYLVMAAYDWGPGNVQRAVMRTGYADFWQLYKLNALPKETKNYVPAMLAAVIMAKNPKQYGLDNIVPMAPVASDTVTVNYEIDMRLVADLTGTTVANIVSLNPSLLRLQTPRDLSFDLHIPQGAKETFLKRVAAIPEDKRDTWRFHEVRAGETLDSVAGQFKVRAHDVAVANDLQDTDAIDAGDELVIPIYAVTSASTTRTQQYKVRRGDTLVTIADRFGVSADALRRWNHLRSSSVPAGKTLYVSEPVRLAPTAHARSRRSRTSSRRTSSHSSHTSKSTSHRSSKSASKTTSKSASHKPSHSTSSSAKRSTRSKKR